MVARWTRARFFAFSLAAALAVISLVGLAETMPRIARQEHVDFFTFLASAANWRAGQSPYGVPRFITDGASDAAVHPNLNHPATVVLFTPLLALSPAAAYVFWTVFGLASLFVALAFALREMALSPIRWPGALVLALALAAPGVAYGLQLGQWGLVLTLPVTAAWLLLRRDRRVFAGLLLGLLVALKPFLFPTLVALLPLGANWSRPRLTPLAPPFAAVAAAAALSVATLPFTGTSVYAGWFAALRSVNWYAHGFNISLVGLASRLVPLATWQVWTTTTSIVVLALVALRRRPGPSPDRADRDFCLLLVASLLAAPLGWLYYTPLLAPVLAVLAAAWWRLPPAVRRLALAALPLLWAPYFLLPLYPETPWSELTLRAAPTYGLVLIAVALALPRHREAPGVVGVGVGAAAVAARGPEALALGATNAPELKSPACLTLGAPEAGLDGPAG